MTQISNDNFRKNIGWIAFLVVAITLSSFVFACATPFAALAAVGALYLKRREAFAMVGAAWFANQFIGYVFQHYPQTTDSFAWGLMIGMGALAAVQTAAAARTIWPGVRFAAPVMAFAAPFAAYEAVLYATAIAARDVSGFSVEIVWYVLEVNAVAFAGLLGVHAIGRAIGLAPAPSPVAS